MKDFTAIKFKEYKLTHKFVNIFWKFHYIKKNRSAIIFRCLDSKRINIRPLNSESNIIFRHNLSGKITCDFFENYPYTCA